MMKRAKVAQGMKWAKEAQVIEWIGLVGMLGSKNQKKE